MPGPFSRSWSKVVDWNEYKNVPVERYSIRWRTSNRVNGKLDLKPQEFSLSHERNISKSSSRYDPKWGSILVPLYGHTAVPSSLVNAARERALGSFHRELKGDHSASLGVTIGSWSQSWSMIAKRYTQISKIARDVAQKSATRTATIEKAYAARFKAMDERLKDLHFRLYALTSRANVGRPADTRRLKRLIRKEEKRRLTSQGALRRDLEKASSANLFLEGIFGWMPLMQDIINTGKTLGGDNFPSGFISGRGAAEGYRSDPPGVPGTLRLKDAHYRVKAKYTAQVSVSNPNVWLANQLGLVNPAVVAWDLIPWSWVVGMFINVQQILESYTALWGLTVTEISLTDQSRIVSTVEKTNGYPPGHPGKASSSATAFSRFKARAVLVGIPTPQLTLRMPELSMSLGLIAAATTTQQVAKFSRNQNR